MTDGTPRGPGTHEPRILARAQQDGQITIATARDAIATQDPPTPSERGMGTRFLKKLVKEGWLEPAGAGMWVPTEKGRSGPYVRRRHATVPYEATTNLPAAEDPLREPVAPEPIPEVQVSDVERVRALMDRADAIRAAGGVVPPELDEALRLARAVHGAGDWRLAVPALFPRTFAIAFASYHEEFWDWLWQVEKNIAPDPFVGVWSRDGGKSASVEAGVIMLGARGIRTYGWYVTSSQDNSDTHVDSVEALLTSSEVAAVYPGMATRDKGKYGPKEWRKNRLVTEAGFVIDAVGLDVASRGRRFEEQRPSFIVIDDVDDQHDTPRSTEKRIATLTRRILPAGSTDCAVVAVQNMIHGRSIFARLANVPGAPEADFLSNRKVSGPIKLVNDLVTQRRPPPGRGYEIVSGEPTWPARGIQGAQSSLDRFGLTAFLVECQHEEGSLGGGIFEHLDFDLGAGIKVTEAALPKMSAVCCWVDPAVSSTDRSDSMGIVVGGLGIDGHYYMLWAWERVTSPLDALTTAILAGVEYGAQVIGVETDQGGDTWQEVYKSALRKLTEDPESALNEMLEDGATLPRYESRKAGSTGQSKAERASRMLVDYELGKVRHLDGTTAPLEAGLKRFPVHKPYDAVDSSYWVWRWLADHGGERTNRFRTRASRGSIGDARPAY